MIKNIQLLTLILLLSSIELHSQKATNSAMKKGTMKVRKTKPKPIYQEGDTLIYIRSNPLKKFKF